MDLGEPDNSAHTMFASEEDLTPAGHLLDKPSSVGQENRECVVRNVASKMGVEVNDIELLSMGSCETDLGDGHEGDCVTFAVETDGERHEVEVRIGKGGHKELGLIDEDSDRNMVRFSLRVEVDGDEVGAGTIDVDWVEPFIKSKLRSLVDDSVNDIELPHDGPRHPISEYRDVFVEGQQLMADSDSSSSRLMRDTLSYITSQLHGQPMRDLKGISGDVWETGQGEVHEETIDAVANIKDKVGEIIDLAVNAHGNSRAADYERWGRRFKADLERIDDLRPIDWSERADEEARKAHETFYDAQDLLGKIRENLSKLDRKAETQRHITDDEDAKEAYTTVRECRRELERITESLDDPKLTGLDE